MVATANDVHGLPPELLRRGRFDELFFVDLPTPAERAEILAIHLRKRERDPMDTWLLVMAMLTCTVGIANAMLMSVLARKGSSGFK